MENNWTLNLLKYYYTVIEVKLTKFTGSLDRQIIKNFKEAEVVARPAKSNGLWCCFLLPTILLLYANLHKVPLVYTQTAYLSMGLLCYSLLFIVFISVSCLILKHTSYAGCVASSFISCLLLYCVMELDLRVAMTLSVVTVFSYNLLLRLMLMSFPKTFTIGELMIVLQGTILWSVNGVVDILIGAKKDDDTYLVNCVVITVLSTVGLLVTALSQMSDKRRNMETLLCIITIALMADVIVLTLTMGSTCMAKLFVYIFMNRTRAQLLSFWMFLLLTAVMALVVRTRAANKATTSMRKTFHVLASLVFASGIIADLQFMRLAAGIGMGLLIFVEALRKSKIDPISSCLESAFKVYKDEKDCGELAVTPMYMYVGFTFPLLLVPEHRGMKLELLSGVLSVGIGDSAASWFGERYGINKWPDGNRTFEGTAFNIISQVAAVYILKVFDLLDSRYALLRTIVAATVVGYVEARTEQVDNLVLPLIMLIAFQVTAFMI